MESKLFVNMQDAMIRDDPKLLDDSGVVPKIERSDWWFDSQL